MVSHDIWAPFSAIKSCQRVVLDGYLKNNLEKDMEMIHMAKDRIELQLSFVKDLLDFTRMEEEHREMIPLSFRPLVLSVVDLMQA